MKNKHLLSVYKDCEDDLHPLKLYAHHFGALPNTFLISEVRGVEMLEALEAKHSDQLLARIQERRQRLGVHDPKTMGKILLLKSGEMLVATEYTLAYHFTAEKLLSELKLKEEAEKFPLKRRKQKARLQLIVPSRMGLRLQLHEIEAKQTDLSLNYNADMEAFHEEMMRKLNNRERRGLHFLYGKPGTGKTHFLRHVIAQMDRDFIYVPSGMAESLSDPAFMHLLMEAKGDVLIIEDAEKAIVSRDASHHNAVSTLLNISDGLLSDILNMQIICTFNTELHNVDKALLRPGRLLSKYEFRPLEAVRAKKLAVSLGQEREIERDLTLAEIYADQEPKVMSLSNKKSVGF